ncbi:hypothetical protein GH714_023956 [Hevea brasiliensis]|uniref:TLC domain-containing protein n=1 Tax=Hevea brasiliensis TaxID=3981 RepID=A0A6A6KSB6_HEVBR|nr:hypothetical protein GH714_023956 [Hevea brasiliensis]
MEVIELLYNQEFSPISNLVNPKTFVVVEIVYYIINEVQMLKFVYAIASPFATCFTFLFLRFVVIDLVFVSASSAVLFILVYQCLKNGSDGLFEHSQLVGGTWEWAYPTLCFSCGYFAYDQLDMLLYRLYSGLIPSILMHHLILLICFTLALYRNVTVNYLILTLICELHSIFLHVRKVRRMAGVRDAKSKIVKLEWVLNWVAFIVARCGSHILITIKLIRDAPKFEKGVQLPLALFGMAGMNLLNAGLGIDLFKAFKREINTLKGSYNHGE